METYRLYDAEYKFVNLIWEVELMDLSELVWSCFVQFGWPKSITLAALRNLCGRGILQVEDSIISARVPKEQIESRKSELLSGKPFRRPRTGFFPFLHYFIIKMKSIMDYKKNPFEFFTDFLS